jgi:hypothetical protein
MEHPFVPLLVLGVAPLVWLAWRAGLPRAAVAAIAWAGVAGSALWSVWQGGAPFAQIERANLWVALAAAGLVACRALGLAGLAERRRYVAGLALLAAVGWVLHFNFFAFHGIGQQRVFVHLHDVAHYYLGAKYFPELGYGSLYTAMLRAEAERYDDHFRSLEARDLDTNALVDIRALLAKSDPVKARFGAERWTAFQADVGYFRDAMGRQWGDVLRDHGFNPTPVWPLVFGPLANLVPAGSATGILALTLLDPLLLAAMFAAIAWAFGVETMLLASIHFCVIYGASFGWTGGGFLRYAWLASTVGGVCCLKRARPATAGALLGVATMLRIFPAAFAAPLALRVVGALVTRHLVEARHVRSLLAFSLTAAALFAGTLALPAGLVHWRDFRRNLERHVESDAYNRIGLTEILAYGGPVKPATPEAFARELERRDAIYGGQLALVLLAIAAITVRRAQRRDGWPDDVGLAALGIPLLFGTLTLGAYYYAFLVLLVLAFRNSPGRIALLFAAEAATRVLLLFEDRPVAIFFQRNLVVAWLLLMLWLPARRAAARRS